MVNYTATSNNIKIIDSWQVSKKKFQIELNGIKAEQPECEVWKRSDCSLCHEWAIHNALYCLGIARSHTKDVDLNYPQKWYVTFAYNFFGAIVWPFID